MGGFWSNDESETTAVDVKTQQAKEQDSRDAIEPLPDSLQRVKEPMWLAADKLSTFNPKALAREYEYVTEPKDQLPAYEKGTHWEANPTEEAKIHYAKNGIAASEATTILEGFSRAAKHCGENVALTVERDGKWVTWTWIDYYEEVKIAARAFIHLGVQERGCVNIIGFNAPEWHISNYAAIFAGALAAGIYATNGKDACKFITEHSEAAVVVVENKGQLDKFLAIRDELPKLKAIVQYTGEVAAEVNEEKEGKKSARVYTWKEFLDLGRRPVKKGEEKDEPEWKADIELKKRAANIRPGHACTLIYTSGTTGTPKAVMLSHDNLIWTCQAFILTLPTGVIGNPNNRIVSYLPLSHIAAQMLDMHAPVVLSGLYKTWTTTYFARPDALKGTILKTLEVAKPTIFFGVPRVWEKFMETMKEKSGSITGFKKSLASWAKSTGRSAYIQNQLGANPNLGPSSVSGYFSNTLVFSKIRSALGLDQALAMYTSAAPISRETLEYFGSIGMPVLELFGMSELTGPQTNSMVNYYRIGATGVTLPGTEILIDHVPDRDKKGEGEVCFRGRHVMMGYMKNAEKSAESIDPDGWLHSGDTGKVDDKGFLYITGRIKELIIGSGGENIAPVPIEDDLKKFLPGISSCMMVGDRRKFNIVLITLKTKLDSEGRPSEDLVGESLRVSPDSKTVSEAKKDENWKKYLTAGIIKTNKNAVSNAAAIQYFLIVEDFSIPGGELTPTMKLKRNVVMQKHAEAIDKLYDEVEAKQAEQGKDNKDKPKETSTKTSTPTTNTTAPRDSTTKPTKTNTENP